MIEKSDILICDFQEALNFLDLDADIKHELLEAPHESPLLPKVVCAVYVFSLSEAYGNQCPANPNRVLKVGKVGSKSNARFQYQHYNPRSAQSTVAGSLISDRILWPYLGIECIDENTVTDWMKKNLDRDHFFLPADKMEILCLLEKFIRARLGPVFEG